MRQMNADFGLLIGNQVRIYYDGNRNPQVDPLLIDKISFRKDEKAGVSFAELFEKDNFQSESYLPILRKKIRKFNIKMERQKLKNILLSEGTKIKIQEFLEKEFADYDSDMFASVMSKINISLESNPVRNTNQPSVDSTVELSKRRIVSKVTPPDNKISGKTYSLFELKNKHLNKEYRPVSLTIQGHTIEVSNWTDLSLKFVKWLIENNFLTENKLPIHTYSERDKYFINIAPQHKIAEKDGQWNLIMGNFHVDTKYNADCHKKNMIHTLKYLGIFDVDIKISFR